MYLKVIDCKPFKWDILYICLPVDKVLTDKLSASRSPCAAADLLVLSIVKINSFEDTFQRYFYPYWNICMLYIPLFRVMMQLAVFLNIQIA